MSYKTILVPVRADSSGLDQIHLAASVARSFDAALMGVASGALDEFLEPAVHYMEPSVRRALCDEIEANLRRAEAMFHGVAGGPSERTLWRTSGEHPTDLVIRCAAAADLIVAGRVENGDTEATPALGALIMAAGLPVLVGPRGQDELRAEHIVVGWKNTLETRRALSGALPFLKRARRVLVVSAVESALDTDVAAELDDIALRLARHGVAAAVEMRTDSDNAAHMLIDAAEREDADLIVAGAFGRGRMREWIFGGVTRSLLRESPTFVLFGR